MTGTNCDLFKHRSFRSYLNHLVHAYIAHKRLDNTIGKGYVAPFTP